MTTRALGTFEVKLLPQATDGDDHDPALGRMGMEKRFLGDLEATSKGLMLSAGTAVKGSAGYVAMERVGGTLHGRRGSFVLQHSGTMTRGEPSVSILVVPDSGTGELAGIAGTMSIAIDGGVHSYAFDYRIGEAPGTPPARDPPVSSR